MGAESERYDVGLSPLWLAVKMQDLVSNQGKQAASSSWEGQESGPSLRASRKECSPLDALISAQ